jgi:hypothetical protein
MDWLSGGGHGLRPNCDSKAHYLKIFIIISLDRERIGIADGMKMDRKCIVLMRN